MFYEYHSKPPYAETIYHGSPSIKPVRGTRLEQNYEVTVGGETMTITNNLASGMSVSFSHNTKEQREPGWEQAAALAFMNNKEVLNLLDLQGMNPDDVMEQIDKQFGPIPVNRAAPLANPSARTAPASSAPTRRSNGLKPPGL